MIEIVKPGLLTTVQDGGRRGYQSFGVPVCGAMDWLALAQANILAGNHWEEAALEITGLGPTIHFLESNIFAIAGADFTASLNGKPILPNSAHLAHKGDVLEMSAAKDGFRGYVAFSGGLELPFVMESRSTCLSAGFGGFEGRALRKDDRIAFRSPQMWLKDLPNRQITKAPPLGAPVHVIPGPQSDAISEHGLDTFFNSEYQFTNQCDRMGCRLEGPAIALKEGYSPNIISDGIAMGSIQVPNGQPIVMMADRQTTGGYVKLGTVASADLPLMAQKRPGDCVRFVRTTVQEAQMLRLRCLRQLRNLEQELNRGDIW